VCTGFLAFGLELQERIACSKKAGLVSLRSLSPASAPRSAVACSKPGCPKAWSMPAQHPARAPKEDQVATRRTAPAPGKQVGGRKILRGNEGSVLWRLSPTAMLPGARSRQAA
jgi:hypothetical protein